MKKIIAIAVLFASMLPIAACSSPNFRKQYETKCLNTWKDSGYKARLIYNRTGNSWIGTEYYDCQVQINGRWIPEGNVRIGETD